MTVLIEIYRGFEISFNTDKETFFALSSEYDTQKEKKSYASTKQYIDEYVKLNNNFVPFQIESKTTHNYKGGLLQVTGIRKDGNFVIVNKKGKPEILSKYDEKDYIVRNPDNDPIREQIKELDKEIDRIQSERDKLNKTITGMSLAEKKKQFTYQ